MSRTHDAQSAISAQEAVESADVVISSLADDAAVRETYAGPDGVAAALHEGQVVLEMSTIAPRTVREIGPTVEANGAALLDAPVSGSVSVVEQGSLTIMVGGDAAALERARSVLDALAAKVVHVGPLGTGATMKLAVNDLIHAIDVGLSEALVLAERAGVRRSVAYDLFAGGAAAAPFVLYKREAFEHPDETPPAFLLDLMAKDLESDPRARPRGRRTDGPGGPEPRDRAGRARRGVLRTRPQRRRGVPPGSSVEPLPLMPWERCRPSASGS